MHTQGKLKVVNGDEHNGPRIADSNHNIVADLFCVIPSRITPLRFDNAIHNARRLVACWNACEGIETEALESGLLIEILRQLQHQVPDRAKEAIAGSGGVTLNNNSFDTLEQRKAFEAYMRTREANFSIVWKKDGPDSISQWFNWQTWLACLAANQTARGEVTK